jgi:hypothetical protein
MFTTYILDKVEGNDPMQLGYISLDQWAWILKSRREEGPGWWIFYQEFECIINNATNVF